MNSSNFHKTGLKDCIGILLEDYFWKDYDEINKSNQPASLFRSMRGGIQLLEGRIHAEMQLDELRFRILQIAELQSQGSFAKNKNKGLTFDEWKNKKLVEASKAIQIGEAEICFVNIFERMLRKANKDSLSNWLKMKNAETKTIGAKHRKEEVCLNMEVRELESLKKKYSKKAFKNWLKIKKKENREKNLRMKKDEACCNKLDEYFYLVKSDYNKKAVKDWLHYLKARNK